ncbi:MAG: CDP-diacylglycerol--glycerol-3-phosphate 3-phosphatidyltransferase [Candidatus Omnitrophica bacterium]|nr:CDP-diacylglycerol--glycerol-3-phosphate 3-phosphatidyltransferase [Candidatus Omnitrophota bacterium]
MRPPAGLPTQLSVLRIILTFVIIPLLLAPGALAKALALLGFLAASFTDWLDGYLARRWGATSALGALLDPLADKVLTLGLFATFAWLGWAAWWMVGVIALREVVVTGARLLAARRRIVLAAAREGKQKMVSQVISLTALFVVSLLDLLPPAQVAERFYALMVLAAALCLWVTVILTIVSGIAFFWRHRVALQQALK